MLRGSPMPSRSSVCLLILGRVTGTTSNNSIHHSLQTRFKTSTSGIRISNTHTTTMLGTPRTIRRRLTTMNTIEIHHRGTRRQMLRRHRISKLIVRYRLMNDRISLRIVSIRRVINNGNLLLARRTLHTDLRLIKHHHKTCGINVHIVKRARNTGHLIIGSRRRKSTTTVIGPLNGLVSTITTSTVKVRGRRIGIIHHDQQVKNYRTRLSARNNHRTTNGLIRTHHTHRRRNALFKRVNLREGRLGHAKADRHS